MLDQMTGPIAAFKGAMANPCTRAATAIEIIEEAVFASLVFEFPAIQIGQTDPKNLTYPVFHRLIGVKSFKLTSGAILVSFRK